MGVFPALRSHGLIRYLCEIWRLRFFWRSLVQIDLRRRYRRSVLGVGWSLLHPIAMTAVLCTVFTTLFQMDVRSYAPFLLVGLITWNYLVNVLNQGCQCFFQGESYIRQYPAPFAIYPLRAMLGAGIHFVLGLVVVVALVWCLNGIPSPIALCSLVPTVAMLFLLGWSLAVCMGVVNVLFHDTQHLTEVAIQLLFYVTPIIYPAEMLEKRHLGWFLALNPAATFLELIRQPVLENAWPSPLLFALAGGMTACTTAIAGLLLWRTERTLIFYL